MFNTKRKRAVVLALIAFFCGATAVVGVDWKRFGGGFLAFFKPKGEPVPVLASGGTPSGGGILTASADSHRDAGPQLALVVPAATHARTSSVSGGSGGHKSEDDLFKYGDPAAGGIPPGSFVVAQNDTAGGGGNAGAPAPASVGGLSAPDTAATGPSGGDAGGGGVSSPAPSPIGGSGDGGIVVKTPAPAPSPATPAPSPTPAPPPVVSPPTPPAPAPTPTQSGTSDQDPGNGGGDTPAPPPPVIVPPPVSAVPEASSAAMMGVGALFLAVAATRRRRNGQA